MSFPSIAWTSFDRYARYGAIARAIDANVGPDADLVLDVGDSTGYLNAFAPDLRVISVDPEVNPRPLPGLRLAVGDGAALPVRDRGVDVVVSSDALEHVPARDRPEFIAELSRCARELVVVAAPFDTPGVAGVEELARLLVPIATGMPQPQLDEHRERGLPDLAGTCSMLEAQGLQVVAYGNGNLRDWLLGMVLKHQAAGAPRYRDLDIGFDVFYNLALEVRNEVAPFYRHVVVARRGAVPVRGAAPEPSVSASLADDLLPTLVAGIAAPASVDARLDAIDARLDGIDGALLHLMERFTGVEAALAQLDGRSDNLQRNVEGIREMLRHPVRAISRRGRDS